MNRERLKALLTGLRRGEVSVASALESLRHWPVEELPFAALDHHRGLRQGCPEVIFCEGKEAGQVGEIAARIFEAGENILATRASPEATSNVHSALSTAPAWGGRRKQIRLPSSATRTSRGTPTVKPRVRAY